MASAIVQMTPFSPSQMSDILMVASENSLESFPGSRDEPGNKRTGTSDGDEDQDRSHVKKRRKQSKPIRITSIHPTSDSKQNNEHNIQGNSDLDFSETGEHFLSERLVSTSAGSLFTSEEYEDLRHRNQDQNKVYNDNQNKAAVPENVHCSLLPLNLSNIKTSFIDSLIVPNVKDSQTINEKPVHVENSIHQFQSSETLKTSTAQESSYLSQSPSLIMPLFKQNQIQNQISQISSQMRIFNPEAFCDLCNKEFCNKYFLKTHKANKHGIYSETQSGPPLLEPMPSIPFTTYFSTHSETYKNSPLFQTTSSAKNVTLFSQTNYPSSHTTPKKTQALPPQPQSNLFSLKSNSSGNMRALCNICQREFCNKYFVRRHKQKIHGIVDPGSKDGSAIDFQENLNFNNNSSQDKLDGSVSEGEHYSGYVKQLLPSNFNIDIFRESLQNSEVKVEKTSETQEKGIDIRESQFAQISQDIPASSESSPIFQVSQNEENNKENALSDIKLKKLGIVNADAFCDICCKEYCNKYFLRTHKLKSHGITTVDDKKEDITNGTSNMWFQAQTMPLNLIVNDAASSNKDVSNKVYFDSEGDECVCGVCGRYFQNQLLLKMHEVQSHSNSYINNENILPHLQPKQFETSKTIDMTNDENSPKQQIDTYFPVVVKKEYFKETVEEETKLTVTAENLKKLQTLILRLNNANHIENSVCDVCEKDVGHVSVLENHILKEHAVLLGELGNIAEEDNCSSQSSVILSSSSYRKECILCQKVYFKPSLFEQHMKEDHGDLDFLSESDNIRGSSESKEISSSKIPPVDFSVQLPEDRQGLQTLNSSFCEICKKELCNKYFMKTHMQRMHGISIENGSQIGGVVCDICNKELCSKYFLRVHKQNSHGIVDELFLPQIGLDFTRNQSPNTDPALKPTDQADLNHRYFTHFNEVCNICNRRFRSLKWLKAHLWNDHGEEGKERYKEFFLPSTLEPKTGLFEETFKETNKNIEYSTFGSSLSLPLSGDAVEPNKNGNGPVEKQSLPEQGSLNNSTFSLLINGGDSDTKQYQCSYCSFTTTILAFLFIHERSHMSANFQFSSEQPSQCPICYQAIESKEHFEKHIKLHNSAWQQSYSLNSSGQDILKPQKNQCEVKTELNDTKSVDAVTQQEKTAHGNINSTNFGQALQNNQQEPTTDLMMQCTRCNVRCTNVQAYLDHLNKEHPYHQMDQELPSYLQQMEMALSTLASNAGIPAAFAVPQMQDRVTMQPFVLEDSEYSSDTNNSITKKGKTFLSSLVFLPVKEKLKKSVTASFKLTPT